MARKKETGTTTALAWVAAADMGLGHKRAAWPLGFLAEGGVHISGSDAQTDERERELWDTIRDAYEKASRLKHVPLVGPLLFQLYSRILAIPKAYPFRDLSKPTLQVDFVYKAIQKGIGSSLNRLMEEKPLPLVSTFYAPALAAEEAGWGRIYCVITDTDLNRVWVARDPKKSRIEYLVPCGQAMRRLKQYGIPDERIWMTGFPLPLELLGDEDLDILKKDLGARLLRLDPNQRFRILHKESVYHFLGKKNYSTKNIIPGSPVTINFAVGGAGAQKEIAAEVLRSIAPAIATARFRMYLTAGVRPEIKEYFTKLKEQTEKEHPGSAAGIQIIWGANDADYFDAFNQSLHDTDILWTKPSELSFYSALGIPLIMAPTIGAQEDRNRDWLMETQAGMDQREPQWTLEWLSDLLAEGRLAEIAWDGFLKARKYGTYKIAELLKTGTMSRENSPLKR